MVIQMIAFNVTSVAYIEVICKEALTVWKDGITC